MRRHEVMWVGGFLAMLLSACCADSESNGWMWVFAAGAAVVFVGFAVKRLDAGSGEA